MCQEGGVSRKMFPLLISGHRKVLIPQGCRGKQVTEALLGWRAELWAGGSPSQGECLQDFTGPLGPHLQPETGRLAQTDHARALPALGDHSPYSKMPRWPHTDAPAPLPLSCPSVHFKVCRAWKLGAQVLPHSPPKYPALQGLRPGLGTHLIRRLQLGVKLAEDLLQVLADDVRQHVQPAPGARGRAFTWHPGHLPARSLPTWDL